MIVTQEGILAIDQNLELRPISLCGRDEFIAVYERNLGQLAAVKEEIPGTDIQEIAMRYDNAVVDVRDGLALEYGIHYDGRLVGVGGLRFAGRGQAEGHNWLDTSYQGCGIATRSARAVISYAFTARDITSILFQIRSGNVPSQRLVARVGAIMTREYPGYDGEAIQMWRKRREY